MLVTAHSPTTNNNNGYGNTFITSPAMSHVTNGAYDIKREKWHLEMGSSLIQVSESYHAIDNIKLVTFTFWHVSFGLSGIQQK